MSRDMKSSRSNRTASVSNNKKSGGSSLITGLLLGLFVGIAIAVVVALFINRSGSPFKNDQTTPADAVGSAPEAAVAAPEVLHPGNGKELNNPAPVPVTETATVTASKPAAATASEERFDFYKMLPELDEKAAGEAKPAAVKASAVKASAAKASAAKPAASASPEPMKPAWLQVGAFKDEGDADNLKAKLALIGVESRILTSDVPDKGIWHRVRVGPFNSAAEIDTVRKQLKTNGIDSAIIKAN